MIISLMNFQNKMSNWINKTQAELRAEAIKALEKAKQLETNKKK